LDAIVIIGAGPAGLAAGACLSRRGLPSRLIDRSGAPGGAYASMYAGMTLATPRRFNALPGLALEGSSSHTTVPEYRAYLERYAAHHALSIEQGTVDAVDRCEDGFIVRAGRSTLEARWVVVASGMATFPYSPEQPGAGVPILHASEWRGPQAYAAERLLIIGGGISAVEIAVEAAERGRRVIVSARRPVRLLPPRILGRDPHDYAVLLEKLPPSWFPGYCARHSTFRAANARLPRLVGDGRIDLRPAIVGWEDSSAFFADGFRADVDLAISATGYRYAAPFLPESVERARRAGHVLARGCESTSWPGLFVLGTPCAGGLDSPFLRGIARDAERVAARIEMLAGASLTKIQGCTMDRHRGIGRR
jgi:putative flavoprotein involved in K+ transport